MNLSDVYKVEILDVAYGDYSVSRVDNFVVFVDSIAVPGDVVKIKIESIRKKFAFASVVDFISLSPFRINSICPYFNEGCGGCHWINVEYRKQIEWKRELIKSLFKRIGKFETDIDEVITTEHLFNYRNKVTLHCKNGSVGLFKRKSFDIIKIENCYQQMSFNNGFIKTIDKDFFDGFNSIVIRSNIKGDLTVHLRTDGKSVSKKEELVKLNLEKYDVAGVVVDGKTIFGTSFIEEKIKNVFFRIPIMSFFQVNYYIAEKLSEKIINIISNKKRKTLFDLYCGVGFFSILLSPYADTIIAVDSDAFAIDFAKINAKLNKISNVKFYTGDALSFFKETSFENIDVVLLDPPRTGCEKELLLNIIKEKISEIIYISCSPDTLARDLSILQENGYKIESVTPFDMFVHTYHIETVVHLINS